MPTEPQIDWKVAFNKEFPNNKGQGIWIPDSENGGKKTKNRILAFIQNLLAEQKKCIEEKVEGLETYASDDFTMTGDVTCATVEVFYRKEDVKDLLKK